MKDLTNMGSTKDKKYDEINLREIFDVLWEGSLTVILFTSLIAIGSIVYSLQLTNYYKSETLIVIRSDSQNQGVLSAYSGVASMIGVSLPSTGSEKAMEAIELIKSRKFVNHLISFPDVLPSIMAAKSYDFVTKKIIYDKNIFNPDTNEWNREMGQNGSTMPSYLEAHKRYRGSLVSIDQDKETGFVAIKVEHISPVFAKEFLELIIREANALLRDRDMRESSQALNYLKSELASTTFSEIRDSINSLIKAQLETQMMTKINEDYSLSVIEPPFVPEQKSKPIRSLIVILSTFFAGFFSVVYVLGRHFFLNKS